MIGKQTTVTTTATLIEAAVNNETREIVIHPSSNMFVGGDNTVTTSNGYLLDAGKSAGLRLTLHPGEALWAIVTSGTHTCYTLLSEI
jgi:hypothetical protein